MFFKKTIKILLLIYLSTVLLISLPNMLPIDSWLKPYYDNEVTFSIEALKSKVPLVPYKNISEFERTIQKLIDEGKLYSDVSYARRGYIVRLENLLSPEQRKKIIFSDGLPLSKAEGKMDIEKCKENKIAFFSSKSGEVVLYTCRKGVLDASRPHLFYRD